MQLSIRAVAALIATCCTLSVQATDVVLHEGDNQLPQYTSVNATFTPETDCKVVIAASDQFDLVQYDGHTYTATYLPSQTPPNIYEIDGVTAGTTISLSSGFVINPLVRISTHPVGEAIPIELVSTLPTAGSDRFWSYNGILSLTFNKQVTLSGAQLSVGSQRFDVEILHVSSAISLNVGDVLNTLLTNGTLSHGQAFMVTVSGLRDANDANVLYNGTGTLNLRFPAPYPQYSLLSATVDGQPLSTSGLNSYAFLSYYAPEGTDGLFVFEFGADVQSVGSAIIQIGNRDLDAQGKYHESALPVTIDGPRVLADARGVLRSLNVLFPAVVEETPEPGEQTDLGLGDYDREHLTLRLSNVKDVNDNYFRAEQVGNVGSYSYFMNYRELMETINLDGDSHMAGAEVRAGDQISLWLSSSDMRFDGIQIAYIADADDGISYEPRTLLVTDFTTEADPYEGIIITFTLPEMPDVVVGQPINVTLHNASSPDGMPHDLSINYVAGEPAGITTLCPEVEASAYVYTPAGLRIRREAVRPGMLVIQPQTR